MNKKTVQIVGPFFTNYSYARVNRGLAFGLGLVQDEYEVKLFGEKNKIDWYPSKSELAKKPEIAGILQLERKVSLISIYNNFPKSISNSHELGNLPSKIKIGYFAWEDDIYPENWVREINENLHGVIVISNFVKNVLINSGVHVPVEVVACAVEQEFLKTNSVPVKINSQKSFKLLHVSTAKARKGIDVLLKAYFEEFSAKDDIVLILKLSPGPDNNIFEQIESLKKIYKKNLPEVEIINKPDLTESELKYLYSISQIGVYPSRAEGFGLPVLETMACNRIAVTTGYSGQTDFASNENSFLINYKLEYAKASEMVNIGARWAEPDLTHLRNILKDLYKNRKEIEQAIKAVDSGSHLEENRFFEILLNAKKTAEEYTWENSAKTCYEFIKKIEKTYQLKKKNAAVLSFINDKTGIAEYTTDLYKNIENSFSNFYYLGNRDIADRVARDRPNVLRNWESGEEKFSELMNFVKKEKVEIFHIQYHSGAVFSPESLDFLIKELFDLKVKIFLTFHAVRGDSFDFIKSSKNLELCNSIFIHNKEDYLYALETLKNVVLFNLPTIQYRKLNALKIKEKLSLKGKYPIVATHGLMNTNKNLLEILKAIEFLKKDFPDIYLLGLNAVSPNNIHAQGISEELERYIKEHSLEEHAEFITEFLEFKEIEMLVQAADINVLAYSDAGESASAAINKCLAAGNPTIVTKIKQFVNFSDEVLKIESSSYENISAAIKNLAENSVLAEFYKKNSQEYVKRYSYSKQALETLVVYSTYAKFE